MKICFLAPANSSHTVKWCKYFVSRGYEVHVISFTAGDLDHVCVHLLKNGVSASGGDMQKIFYLTHAHRIKKIIKDISPDIINVHYATSYGAVAALAGLKNYVLSVWGSDIFDFPNRSVLHRALLKYSLKHAKYLFSTSCAMAEEGKKYTDKAFEITPFGVDMDLFTPEKRTRNADDGAFILGTVKTLAPAYGIDIFLQAVHLVKTQHPEIPIQLRIAGTGPLEKEYRKLAEDLGVDAYTSWLGFISQEQASVEWANMDVAVICSIHESFGVSAVEAQASGCPIIISKIPGLMEATCPDETSTAVPPGDPQALANAIAALYRNPERRKHMGVQGRKFVCEKYEVNKCFQKVERLFSEYSANDM